MKIAVTKSYESYALKMKDCSGLAVDFLSFAHNLLLEIGTKQKFLLDWDYGIGVETKDNKIDGNYDIYEVSDFAGYLILDYQRDLCKNLAKLSGSVPKEEEELVMM